MVMTTQILEHALLLMSCCEQIKIERRGERKNRTMMNMLVDRLERGYACIRIDVIVGEERPTSETRHRLSIIARQQ